MFVHFRSHLRSEHSCALRSSTYSHREKQLSTATSNKSNDCKTSPIVCNKFREHIPIYTVRFTPIHSSQLQIGMSVIRGANLELHRCLAVFFRR
jgi:hypothetical protein